MQQPNQFDPTAFLQVAQELAAAGEERRLRTAVGRAYYAIFLLARERTGAYPTDRNHSAHSLVLAAVSSRKGFRVANELNQLKKLRITADYQLLPVKTSDQDWARNWSGAQWLIDRLLPEILSI
jgi:uncharacterized protein (UPF0332 family)